MKTNRWILIKYELISVHMSIFGSIYIIEIEQVIGDLAVLPCCS